MKNLKIVLTGGHAGSTAFSLVEQLNKDRDISFEIYWLGNKNAVEGKVSPTKEYLSLPKQGVKFIPIYTGRIQRRFTVWTIPALLKIPIGFLHAFYLLITLKPGVIFSFGGFSAFPVVVVGWILRIPIIIHEQTMAAGRANRYSAFFANRIALARKESEIYFPKEKCTITGNPMPSGVASVQPKTSLGNPPVIFVHGGSSGAEIINKTILKLLPQLLVKYQVIHQTGVLQEQEFIKHKNNLTKELAGRYQVFGVIDTALWANYFTKTDVLVSRSGANIVSELVARKVPSILIPIPYAYLDEQTKNAQYAKNYGLATIIPQDQLTPELLFQTIEKTINDWAEIVKKVAKKSSPDIGAADRLVKLIKEVAG